MIASAISFFDRFSARHNTIRARVATAAGTSGHSESARNSDISSVVNCTLTANTVV